MSYGFCPCARRALTRDLCFAIERAREFLLGTKKHLIGKSITCLISSVIPVREGGAGERGGVPNCRCVVFEKNKKKRRKHSN